MVSFNRLRLFLVTLVKINLRTRKCTKALYFFHNKFEFSFFVKKEDNVSLSLHVKQNNTAGGIPVTREILRAALLMRQDCPLHSPQSGPTSPTLSSHPLLTGSEQGL